MSRPRTIAATNTPLTARETEIVILLGQGRTAPDIAAALNFSEGTIRRDISIIYRKLGVGKRVEVVRVAQNLGLI